MIPTRDVSWTLLRRHLSVCRSAHSAGKLTAPRGSAASVPGAAGDSASSPGLLATPRAADDGGRFGLRGADKSLTNGQTDDD